MCYKNLQYSLGFIEVLVNGVEQQQGEVQHLIQQCWEVGKNDSYRLFLILLSKYTEKTYLLIDLFIIN